MQRFISDLTLQSSRRAIKLKKKPFHSLTNYLQQLIIIILYSKYIQQYKSQMFYALYFFFI